MGNCARSSHELALDVQKITYEVDPASCASRRRRTAADPNQMPAHSPDARWGSLPRSVAFYLRRSFYLAAYVRCWISSHRARDPQRDRAAFRPRQSRTASEPQGNGIEFASENPGIAAGGRATCLQNEGISGTSNAKSSLRRPGNPFSYTAASTPTAPLKRPSLGTPLVVSCYQAPPSPFRGERSEAAGRLKALPRLKQRN